MQINSEKVRHLLQCQVNEQGCTADTLPKWNMFVILQAFPGQAKIGNDMRQFTVLQQVEVSWVFSHSYQTKQN